MIAIAATASSNNFPYWTCYRMGIKNASMSLYSQEEKLEFVVELFIFEFSPYFEMWLTTFFLYDSGTLKSDSCIRLVLVYKPVQILSQNSYQLLGILWRLHSILSYLPFVLRLAMPKMGKSLILLSLILHETISNLYSVIGAYIAPLSPNANSIFILFFVSSYWSWKRGEWEVWNTADFKAAVICSSVLVSVQLCLD